MYSTHFIGGGLHTSVGTNSVRIFVFGFFGNVREVRSSVLENKLDVRIVRNRIKVRANISELVAHPG